MLAVPMIAFFILLAAGLWMGELSFLQALVFLGIWLIALAGFGLLGLPRAYVVGVESLLSIVLILMLFGGDLRLR